MRRWRGAARRGFGGLDLVLRVLAMDGKKCEVTDGLVLRAIIAKLGNEGDEVGLWHAHNESESRRGRWEFGAESEQQRCGNDV